MFISIAGLVQQTHRSAPATNKKVLTIDKARKSNLIVQASDTYVQYNRLDLTGIKDTWSWL